MEELELLKEITALLREQNASAVLMQMADLTARSVQAEIKVKEISAENMALRARIKELEKEVERTKVGERGATTEVEYLRGKLLEDLKNSPVRTLSRCPKRRL